MNLPTKSKFAFESSVAMLPVSRKENLYLWTFTFVEVISVEDARRRWSAFLNKLRMRKRYRQFQGLRVFQLHPGGHGLHIHVVTGEYLRINDARGLWMTVGGGRIHVKPIAASRANYLSRYLKKQGRPECFRGVRMWDAFGGLEVCRIKDVRIESNWTRTYAALVLCLGVSFTLLPYWMRGQAVANVERERPWNFGLFGYSAEAFPGLVRGVISAPF